MIGVVFGGRTAKSRDRHMAKLLDKGFKAVKKREIVLAANEARREKAAEMPAQWAIQVGAFGKRAPAYDTAHKAIEMAPDILDEGAIRITPLKKRNGKTLFRARVIGLRKEGCTSRMPRAEAQRSALHAAAPARYGTCRGEFRLVDDYRCAAETG